MITARGCPYTLPLVQPRRVRLHPSPPQRRRLRQRARVDPRHLSARSGLVCRRRVHASITTGCFEYAAELKRRGLRLPFETISRADRMMSEEVLATLAEMGCYRIWIGAESGSQRILDAMQRGVTVEQVQ